MYWWLASSLTSCCSPPPLKPRSSTIFQYTSQETLSAFLPGFPFCCLYTHRNYFCCPSGFFVALTRFNCQVGFSFPYLISAHLDGVSISPPRSLVPENKYACCFFQLQSSHSPMQPPSTSDFLFVKMDHSWAWRRWSLKISHTSWTPLFRTLSHGILSCWALNRPESALLKSKVSILLFAFFQILKCTISWSLHLILAVACTLPNRACFFMWKLWIELYKKSVWDNVYTYKATEK